MLFFSSEIAGSCNALVNYASTSIRLRFDDATAIRPRRTTVRRPTIKTDMLFFPAYKLIVVKSIRAKPEEGFLLVQLLLNSCCMNIKGERRHREVIGLRTAKTTPLTKWLTKTLAAANRSCVSIHVTKASFYQGGGMGDPSHLVWSPCKIWLICVIPCWRM